MNCNELFCFITSIHQVSEHQLFENIRSQIHIHIHQKQPPDLSYKNGGLKNFAKFIGKHLCQSLFLNKIAVLRSAALLKKRLWHRCFLGNFVKFLKTPFLQNNSGQQLLIRIHRISHIPIHHI